MGAQTFAIFDLTDEGLARLVYLAGLMILVGGGLRAYRNRLPQALKHAGIWVLIFLGTNHEPESHRASQPLVSRKS